MGKVLHDTSRLTEEYRSGVRRLMDFTTVLNIVEFPKALELSGLNILYPTRVDYSLAIQVSKELLKLGKPIPAIDVIVAAVALNNGLTVKTKDHHFTLIKDVKPGFKIQLL